MGFLKNQDLENVFLNRVGFLKKLTQNQELKRALNEAKKTDLNKFLGLYLFGYGFYHFKRENIKIDYKNKFILKAKIENENIEIANLNIDFNNIENTKKMVRKHMEKFLENLKKYENIIHFNVFYYFGKEKVTIISS